MSQSTITVKQAIHRYRVQVILPLVLIVAGGTYVCSQMFSINAWLGVAATVVTLLSAFVFPAILHTHWFVWAFLSVDHPRLLYVRAISNGFVKPRNSFWTKWNVTITVDKELYHQAWIRAAEMGNVDDLVRQLPPDRIVKIHNSKRETFFLLGLTLLLTAYLIWMWFYDDKGPPNPKGYMLYYLGGPASLYLWWRVVDSFRNYGKLAMEFSPAALYFFGEQYSWQSIHRAGVEKPLIGNTWTIFIEYYTIDPETIEQKVYRKEQDHEGLDCSVEKVEELFVIYRHLYTT